MLWGRHMRVPSSTVVPAPVWPGGKRFAFTIFDDADLQTVANGRPVYDFLGELGMRITKSVWVLPPEGEARYDGQSCDEPDYLTWVRSLQCAGHEIALHNVSSSTSSRERTLAGLDRYRALFGSDPASLANHVGNLEAMYHGEERISGARRALYNVLTRGRRRGVFRGQDTTSPLFWGDACLERVTYVRNFVFRDINTLRACPHMPYHDPAKPFVRFWFAAAEGSDPSSFVHTLRARNVRRLEAEGGLCIMYTHLGAGFYRGGRLHPGFERVMRDIAGRNGWFAPVSKVLDHLRAARGDHDISPAERRSLEWRWLRSKLLTGGTS